MKECEAVIATSRIDQHGEAIAVEALRSLADSIGQSYLPVGVEHDPRHPPVGRIKSAHVRQAPDGEYEVVAVLELFYGDVSGLAIDTERIIKLKDIPAGRVVISYDRSYRNDRDHRDLTALAEAIDAALVEEGKKALEPISVLIIGAGLFVLGAIAKGFLGKLGQDGYEKLKDGLKSLLARRKPDENEKLLMFEFVVRNAEHVFHVQLIATNPSAESIDAIFEKHLADLDALLPHVFDERVGLSKLVFELKENDIQLSFAIRKDCVPVIPKKSVMKGPNKALQGTRRRRRAPER